VASHKNQHFVPRCYLKPFSYLQKGRVISLYNLDSRVSVKSAPLKSQCAGSYFYGEDLRLERLLEQAEGTYSETLRGINSPRYSLTESGKTVLRHFCYLQHCRTEAALQRMATPTLDIMRIAGDTNIPSGRSLKHDTVLAGMRAFAATMPSVYDLKVCLVRNRTSRHFFTSDDPAVLTNRWYQQSPQAKGGSGGAGNAGALFFLPLTSQILCVLYDGDVYSIPNCGGWATVSKTSDVDAFNEHQILHCMTNLYFADRDGLAAVECAVEATLPRRPAARYEITVAVLDRENAWGEYYRVIPRDALGREGKAFFHARGIPLRPSRWPSIIGWRSTPKIYSNGSGTGFVRRWTLENGTNLGVGYHRVR
jgi:Protein of unknown function (DUF4238)